MNKFSWFLILLHTIAFSTNAWSADFSETFDSPTVSPLLQVSADTGYSFQQLGGRGAFQKVANSPDGSVVLTTSFQALGDFSISVDVDGRADGPLYPGLNISWLGSSTQAQIYFFGPRQTYRAISAPSIGLLAQGFGSTNAQELKFKINRTGSTLSLFVDRGDGGFDLVLDSTNSAFTGPVVAQLIAVDADSGPNGNGAGTSYFDNFLVHADSLSSVPELNSSMLFLTGILIFIGRARPLSISHHKSTVAARQSLFR